MDLNLQGKSALVMGSSSGIGKAIAESLIQEGCRVALCARNQSLLEKTADDIGASTFFVGDLTQPGEAKRITHKAFDYFKGLDILVTNTGGPAKGNFQEITANQWQQDFQSLWMSVIESTQFILPHMIKNQFGRILMVTSLAAKEPLAGLTTSNGLRAGLTGLAKSLSSEVATYGITVNIILPGYTNTERLQALNLSEEKIMELVPAGRLGHPEELGNLAAYLASPKAGYITGQSIAIDGGALKSH